jgi:hypothetical protein
MDEATEVKASTLVESLKGTAAKLTEALAKAVEDVTTLQVTTYVADEVDTVKYDPQVRALAGGAGLHLRALTHIRFDGDTSVCVPLKKEEIDEALWKLHNETVAQAQLNRQQFIQTMAEAAANLIKAIKSL